MTLVVLIAVYIIVSCLIVIISSLVEGFMMVDKKVVAPEFVGNYAPCGLSPQIDGMPVIPKKREVIPLSYMVVELKRFELSTSTMPLWHSPS